jgi:uncharacterized heparinase superfamily protein
MMDLSAVVAWPRLSQFIFGSRLYTWTLSGSSPEQLRGIPPQPWPGNPAAAIQFLDSPSLLPGITKALSAVPWHGLAESNPKALMYHRFSWLADLHAVGTEAARKRAQALLLAWIDDQSTWQAVSWQPDILGERLSHWLNHHEFLMVGLDEPSRHRVFISMARQVRHLKHVMNAPPRDDRAFWAIKGLIYSGVCLPGFESVLDDGLSRLERLTVKQILPDGGHISRNPSLMFRLLQLFIDLRSILMAGQIEVPAHLQGVIDRMGPSLRGLRLGDGGMALFNGGTTESNDSINQTFIQAGTKTKAIDNAPHTGYQRMVAKRTVILLDAGKPPPSPFDRKAHAAPLSFEMSVGKERLIVNCGSFTGSDPTWRNALRATAAHSVVSVNDTNAIETAAHDGLLSKNLDVDYARQESEGDIWLEASHNGYNKRFKINHKRRLYLAADGEDIRGDDELTGDVTGTYDIRFHFHPDVSASLVQEGSAVLMRLKSGTGWRLHVNGGLLSLDDSIYLGDGRNAKRSQQAVISGSLGPDGALVKWRLDHVKS